MANSAADPFPGTKAVTGAAKPEQLALLRSCGGTYWKAGTDASAVRRPRHARHCAPCMVETMLRLATIRSTRLACRRLRYGLGSRAGPVLFLAGLPARLAGVRESGSTAGIHGSRLGHGYRVRPVLHRPADRGGGCESIHRRRFLASVPACRLGPRYSHRRRHARARRRPAGPGCRGRWLLRRMSTFQRLERRLERRPDCTMWRDGLELSSRDISGAAHADGPARPDVLLASFWPSGSDGSHAGSTRECILATEPGDAG